MNEETQDKYVVIETEFGKEYKIGMLSYRFTGPPLYMLLADTYYLGNETPYGPSRQNKFTTYSSASLAVAELTKEYNRIKKE
jgi:hypothetical protein